MSLPITDQLTAAAFVWGVTQSIRTRAQRADGSDRIDGLGVIMLVALLSILVSVVVGGELRAIATSSLMTFASTLAVEGGSKRFGTNLGVAKDPS